MIIRIILLGALAAIGYLGFVRRNRLPVNIMVVFAILVVAGLCVLFPDAADPIAVFVGLEYTKDLIIYLVLVCLLFLSLHFYTKFVDHQRQITVLVREMAILKTELAQSRRGTLERSSESASA
jgi:hypothetical protein